MQGPKLQGLASQCLKMLVPYELTYLVYCVNGFSEKCAGLSVYQGLKTWNFTCELLHKISMFQMALKKRKERGIS